MSGYAGLMNDRRKNMSDSSDLVLSAFELDGTAVELADQDDLWWFVTQGTVIGG
jgi:predicted RNA-binding protein associated with RNAse of E/G family